VHLSMLGLMIYGGTTGLEIYKEDDKTPEEIGKNAGNHAKGQLEAKVCPGGKFRVFNHYNRRVCTKYWSEKSTVKIPLKENYL